MTPEPSTTALGSPLAAYFSSDWIVQRLCADACGWVGTPFAPHSQVRGAGVDCVHLCAALYEGTGFMDGFHPPAYAIDAGSTNDHSQIMGWLQQNRQFAIVFERSSPKVAAPRESAADIAPQSQIKNQKSKIPASHPSSFDALLPGDLLLFRVAAVEHHCGVLLGRKKFVHARAGVNSKVAIDSLTDPVYRRCLTFAFRPLAPQPEGPAYKEVMG